MMQHLLALALRPVGSRVHGSEIHETEWCPRAVRDGLTDTLAAVWTKKLLVGDAPLRLVGPHVARVATACGARDVLDLCSGAGGPVADLAASASELETAVRSFTLTDLFPNEAAAARVNGAAHATGLAAGAPRARVSYYPRPADARALPADLVGAFGADALVRTMFGSMHHLRPDDLEGVLRDVVRRRDGFAAFEFQNRSPGNLLWIGLFGLLAPWGSALMSRDKYSLSPERFVLTFVVPLIPLAVWLDGIVSCLRTYSEAEFLAVARAADPDGEYEWAVASENIDGLLWPLTRYEGVPKSSASPSSSTWKE